MHVLPRCPPLPTRKVMPAMAVSPRLRFRILHRDGFRCRYCGVTAADEALAVDHVIPVSFGGSDHPTNLVTACVPCNTGKSDMPLWAEPIEDVPDPSLNPPPTYAATADLVARCTRAAGSEVLSGS